MKKLKKVMLCEGRHEIPQAVDGSIFPHTVNLNNLREVDELADKFICQCRCDECDLYVYCTGVQYPLVAVINACLKRGVKMTLWHYDPKTKAFYHQSLYQI